MKGVKFTNRCLLSAVAVFLLFAYLATTFWPVRSQSDFERTMHIVMKSVNLKSTQNEFLGPFLARDWTEDIRKRRIFTRNDVSKCDASTELLVGVISRAKDFELRREIRRTWANSRNHTTTKVLFFLGRSQNDTSDLQREASLHNDLVFINSDERYYNLSMKTHALLRYHQNHCAQAKCILKVDTDVVVNLNGIERLCRDRDDAPLITGGGRDHWATVNRNNESKYYVPHHVYNAEMFPPYAEGPSYLLSGQNVSTVILEALTETPFYHSENFRRLPEDVIFNGIARSIAEVPFRKNGGFSLYKDEFSFWCPPDSPPIPLVYHGAEPLDEYWEKIRRYALDARSFGWWETSSVCGFWSTAIG